MTFVMSLCGLKIGRKGEHLVRMTTFKYKCVHTEEKGKTNVCVFQFSLCSRGPEDNFHSVLKSFNRSLPVVRI